MKRIVALILSILIVLSAGTLVFADDVNNPNLERLVDKADVFTAEQEASLKAEIDALIQKHGLDFVIYTDNDAHGKSLEAGADDFYDQNGYGCGSEKSGVVLYICFDPDVRSWWTSACGKSMNYFDYDNINIIDDAIMGSMVDGDYAKAMSTYISYIDALYANGSLYNKEDGTFYAGEQGWQSYTNQDVEKPVNKGVQAGIMFVFSAVIGLCAGIFSKNKAKKSMIVVENAQRADKYKAKGSFRLTRSENIFLNMVVTRVPKPQPSNNNGGSMHSGGSSFSSSHISSSGMSHSGGGGRHF